MPRIQVCVQYGTPAPPRSVNLHSIGGKPTGVGFTTGRPTRPIPGKWSAQLGDAVRRHAAHLLVDNTWVSGGVFYGLSFQSERVENKQLANDLLQEMVQVIEPQPGPRFISGDFNQTSMPIMEWLESKGWADAQTIAHTRWGVDPQPTCKATSRKDFLMLCPRLQQHVQGIRVLHEPFPDHAVLDVLCGSLGRPEAIPKWLKPNPILFTTSQQT